MDSIGIISLERSTPELDIQFILETCLIIRYSFRVSFQEIGKNPRIYIYDNSPKYDEDENSRPDMRVDVIDANESRDEPDLRFGTLENPMYWAMSIRAREWQFVLPFVIELLSLNSNYRVFTVMGQVLDLERITKAYKETDYAWAYLEE